MNNQQLKAGYERLKKLNQKRRTKLAEFQIQVRGIRKWSEAIVEQLHRLELEADEKVYKKNGKL